MVRGDLTFRQFAELVYWPSRLRKRRPDELFRTLAQFDLFTGGAPVSQVSDESVTAWLHSCLSAGDLPNTINSKRARVLAVWRSAWRKRVVSDPPRDVPRSQVERTPPVARTAGELSALLRACELQSGAIWGVDASDYWSSLILALFATGERFSAVCSSRWQDFDSASKTLSIVASATKTKCGRVYKLTDQATTAIELMRFPPRELIWPWPHCRRYRWTVLRRIFEAAGLFCEGERQLAHSIRRSTISYAAAVDLEMARRQAGHYSASLTLSAYVDPRIASLSQAADVLPTI